jgi:MFS family permease
MSRAAAGRPTALRSPAFVRLWTGSIVSSVGTQMSNTAKLWLLYALTRSAVTLGVDGLCFSVPIVILPLVAGPVCDRVDRHTVVKVSMAAESLEAAALAAAAAAGVLRPWIIYLAAVTEAARLAFDIPARTALTTALVPRDAVLSAQSLSAVVWNSAALAGPALGGLLLATTGATAVFAVNSISTLIVGLGLLPPRPAGPPPPADRAGQPARLGDGLRYALAHRELLALQGVLLATSTIALGTETLLPVLDRAVWHGGPIGYGMLRAAPGIAAVLTGIAISSMRPARHPWPILVASMISACTGLIAFTWAPLLAVGCILLALAFAAVSVAQILVATQVQQTAPERLRSSISGFNAITQSGLAGIAAAGMAITAASLGARTVIEAAAALTALAALIAPARTRRKPPLDSPATGEPRLGSPARITGRPASTRSEGANLMTSNPDAIAALPPIVAEHIDAVNAFDTDRIVATFARDAYVNDARREIWGTEAISKFVAKEFVGDHVTMEVREVIDHYGDIIVRARYDGTYDKSNLPDELVMTSYFGLRDGKITSLTVIFNQPSPY